MNESRLHVTFTGSGSVSLQRVLARLNRAEDVARLLDDFSMGPIDPGDADQRFEWQRDVISEEDPTVAWSAKSPAVAAFWEKVSTWPGKILVWMSSHCVVELCGLHALLWRLPNANIDLIDIANVEFRSDGAPQFDERQAFATVRDERIVEHGLIDLATPISDATRATYREQWQQLRKENAPLRVLTDKGLVSAAIEHFDARIRAQITNDWRRCSYVVVDVMTPMWNAPLLEFSSERFIFTRLLDLLDEDEFEGETDEELWSMRSRVRRRPLGGA
jgi:hypothetical protein